MMQMDLAVMDNAVKTQGECSTSEDLRGHKYTDVKILVMDGLLWDIIVGRDFLSQRESVNFKFDRLESPMELGALLPFKT